MSILQPTVPTESFLLDVGLPENVAYWLIEFYGSYGPIIDAVFYGLMIWVLIDNLRKTHRLHKGTDIIVHPQLTLFTEDGDKIHVLSINEEQGRYVLYHSRSKGLQLATHREFLMLKSGGYQNEGS